MSARPSARGASFEPAWACLLIELPAPSASTLAELSPSLREVAELVARNFTNADIAAYRGTSTRTVANQLAQLFERLEVSSRCGIARRLEQYGAAPAVSSAVMPVRSDASFEGDDHESVHAA